MRTVERMTYMQLCRFRHTDKALLEELLQNGGATPAVLGKLFSERMAGIAAYVLEESGLVGQASREFRNALCGHRAYHAARNKSYKAAVQYLSRLLEKAMGEYVFLKGAMLCDIYPDGCRMSNDVDLLMSPDSISEIGEILADNGFLQGDVRNGVFVPAQRRDILSSRMMRGETVPYIKKVDMPFLTYLEVDLNFSVDAMNHKKEVTENLLTSRQQGFFCGEMIWTLQDADFFLHLCAHLHKEAATYPWVAMKRDMTMYKYADLYLLLDNMNMGLCGDIAQRAAELGLAESCIYAVKSTEDLFGESAAGQKLLCDLRRKDMSFMHRVISPAEKKTYQYRERNVVRRFFANDRARMLSEVGEWKH